jgi:ceramide synthetase
MADAKAATAVGAPPKRRAGWAHRPNKALDVLLNGSYVGLVVYTFWVFGDEPLSCAILAGAIVAMHGVVWLSSGFFRALGKWLSAVTFAAGMVNGAQDPLKPRLQMKKWLDQSWQLLIHVSMTAMELWVLADEVWWQDTPTCWQPATWLQGTHLIKPALKAVYLLQLAIWIYTCFVHVFVAERIKDYYVMFAHHCVTIALLALSAHARFFRIGLLVLLVHDFSDVFVDLLKMVSYLKLDGRRGWFLTELAYVACVFNFIYWRLFEFPLRVIHSSAFDSYIELFVKRPELYVAPTTLWERLTPPIHMYCVTNALLIVLLCMHVYWTLLFFRLGYRMLAQDARVASREEYEGESDKESGPDEPGAKPKLKDAAPAAAPTSTGSGSGSAGGRRRPVKD